MLELPALLFILAIIILGVPAYFLGVYISKQFKLFNPKVFGLITSLMVATIIVLIALVYALTLAAPQ